MEEKDITFESVENQEVAAPEKEDIQSQQPQEIEAVEPNEEQIAATDRDGYFADMRRKQELEDFKSKNEILQKRLELAQGAMHNYFEGDTVEEMADYAIAQAQGVDVQTIKEQRQQTQKQIDLENQIAYYQRKEIEAEIENDLKAIQSIDPTVTSLDDLPEMFLALRFNKNAPLSAKEAFVAMKSIEKQIKPQKPASIGSMKEQGVSESEYFTSDELDRLSSIDLQDQKTYEKAMRSIAKLK